MDVEKINSLHMEAEGCRLEMQQAKKDGDYKKAKEFYLKASKIFIELAGLTTGEESKTYKNKADELINLANDLLYEPTEEAKEVNLEISPEEKNSEDAKKIRVRINSLIGKTRQYFSAVQQAKKENQNEKAKKLYLEASKVYIELSELTKGNYSKAYKNKADELIALAEGMPDKQETDSEKSIIPDVTFEDVAGLDDVKKAIDTRIIKPRENPNVYKALDITPGGGIMMYGVPGTGKTMMAKAIANKTGAAFFPVSCGEIIGKWLGDGEGNVKRLFDRARKEEVAIIFFDEFDSIGAKLKDDTHDAIKRMVSELKIQIDGFKSSFNTLMVIAATNRPWEVDNSFLRPGRFGEMLHIDLPDKNARKVIIEKKLGKYSKYIEEKTVDFDELAKWTEGFNGADVTELCDRVKMLAADKCIEKYGDDITGLKITIDDVDEIKKQVKSSVRDEDIQGLKIFEEMYRKNIINPKNIENKD